MDDTKELKEYFAKLTPEAQEVLTSSDWHSRVEQIAKKYTLTEEQKESIEYEILFVILGMSPETELLENIKKELSISELLATQIVTEINTRVISFIVDAVEKKSLAKEKGTQNQIHNSLPEMENRVDTDSVEEKPSFIPTPRYIPPKVKPESVTQAPPQAWAAPAPKEATNNPGPTSNTGAIATQKPWLKPLTPLASVLSGNKEENINNSHAPANLPGMEIETPPSSPGDIPTKPSPLDALLTKTPPASPAPWPAPKAVASTQFSSGTIAIDENGNETKDIAKVIASAPTTKIEPQDTEPDPVKDPLKKEGIEIETFPKPTYTVDPYREPTE